MAGGRGGDIPPPGLSGGPADSHDKVRSVGGIGCIRRIAGLPAPGFQLQARLLQFEALQSFQAVQGVLNTADRLVV